MEEKVNFAAVGRDAGRAGEQVAVAEPSPALAASRCE